MNVLPDLLEENLKVVFCGTAAGSISARAGAYYAAPGNQFWKVLYRIGLTQQELAPHEYRSLLAHGIGLTDLVKSQAGVDKKIFVLTADFAVFREKIERYAPQVLAFNGKQAAEDFLGRSLDYGRQLERIGHTVIFVLPSTSGAAKTYWCERYWKELAFLVGVGRAD